MITSDLPLFRIRQQVKRAVTECGQRLEYLLSILSDGRWHTAKELRAHGFRERELRDLVEHSEGQILSFPGSPGYKAFDHATIDEIDQSKALLNQGRAMIRRFLRYKKRFHRRT
jgi:hypothetical protein